MVMVVVVMAVCGWEGQILREAWRPCVTDVGIVLRLGLLWWCEAGKAVLGLGMVMLVGEEHL